jgi:hypothetical protein
VTVFTTSSSACGCCKIAISLIEGSERKRLISSTEFVVPLAIAWRPAEAQA